MNERLYKSEYGTDLFFLALSNWIGLQQQSQIFEGIEEQISQ